MPKQSHVKNLQYELWPKTKWEWRENYLMGPVELKTFWTYTYVKDGHLLWSGHTAARMVPTYWHRHYKRLLSARRIAWTIYYGAIEKNMDVVAACGNRRCISYKCVRKVPKNRNLNSGRYKYD